MVYNLFEKGGHRITIRNRTTGHAKSRMFFNQMHLNKILEGQKSDEDVYIEKYPKSRIVQVVILDLDSEDDIKLAYTEARRCYNYFNRNGNNTVIVSSGKKGYHVYVQIAPCHFTHNEWFKCFIDRMLDGMKKPLTTLDEINSSAGLGGNIRVIGSTHPSTGNKCEIVKGEFKGLQTPTELSYNSVMRSHNDFENFALSVAKLQQKRQNNKKNSVEFGNIFDPIKDIDLRDVFRQLSSSFKEYSSGYCFCNCLWHSDSNPSLLVTENYYSCAGCGEKGNIYTLKKKGLVDWRYDGKWECKR